jgi:predicted nuclease with TOPRIM domain
LQEKYNEAISTTDTLREEVRRLVSAKAELTGQLHAAKSEVSLMKEDLSRQEKHAALAESTQKLDQDEVKRLKKDLDTMQGVHMEDTKHLRELSLKLKVLPTCCCWRL